MNRRRRQPRRSSAFAAAAAVAGLLLGAATGAQEGPIVFGEREESQWIQFNRWRAWADLEFRYQRDKNTPAGAEPITFRERRFLESFTLANTGSIVHPNLVELNLEGSFGLTQQWIDVTGQDEYQSGTVYDYDVSALFLRKEDAPVTLYSRRTQNLVNRQFGPSLDNTITQSGVIWDIRSKTLPTRFEIFHSRQEQSGIASDVESIGDFAFEQLGFLWHSEYRPHDSHVITWDYAYTNNDESTAGFGSNTFDVHDATLTDSIDFGDQRQNNLTSTINYFNQSGDFPVERILWRELLRLRHSRTFETRYQYALNQQSFGDLDQTQHRATAGFTHRLYRSLVTRGDIGVQQLERSDNADSFEYFGDLSFDYTKQVPFGTFLGLLGFGWDRTHNDAQSQVTQVFGDARTFADSQPIVVSGRGVIPESLRVTDPTGLILFIPGVDYTVQPFPTFLQIDRVIGGRIGAGETVLLDYQLQPFPENVVTTGNFRIGGRYTLEEGPLKGVTIYTRYARQDQDIDSDSPSEFIENSFEDLVYGAEYRFWREQMTIGVERQHHDATIAPFDATRYFARYTSRVARSTTFIGQLNYDQFDYHEQENQVNLFLASAQIRHEFSRRLRGFATIVYRNEDDEQFGDTIGLEEQIELQWQHRQTTVYGLLRNTNLDGDTQDSEFFFAQVGIRREF